MGDEVRLELFKSKQIDIDKVLSYLPGLKSYE
jgi:hypothetical protein